ncbi:MAG: Hsp20/alpha crystallin family protein [Kiritimatiellae bacterium]|nr:Hsp20/alpha crystallin family protein [Kiritimatiellia bacterium]
MTKSFEPTGQPTGSAEPVEPSHDRPVFAPPTDIYETEDAIMVVADMPDVDERSVVVNLENDVLSITGHAVGHAQTGYRLATVEYTPANYRRTFNVVAEIEEDGITATIKQGVLTVRLPKTGETAPRRIAVQAG